MDLGFRFGVWGLGFGIQGSGSLELHPNTQNPFEIPFLQNLVQTLNT